MEKNIHHHCSAAFTLFSRNPEQLSQWERKRSTGWLSTCSFRASINVLKCFSEQQLIRIRIKLIVLETHEWSHYIEARI